MPVSRHWFPLLLARGSRNATSDWFITSLPLQRLQLFHWLISAFCGSNPTELKVQLSHLESKTLLDFSPSLLNSFQQRLCISRHSTTRRRPSTSTISISPNTQHPEDGPPTSRISTLNLYSLQKIPYSFPPDQLKAMNIKDASTFLGTSQGWPSLFVVE